MKKTKMNRREFLARTALFAGAVATGSRYWRKRTGPTDMLAYLDQQLTPAAAAAVARKRAIATNTPLSSADLFWSVMWPYMYTIGRAEGTVGNSYGINPNQVIYTFDSFSSYADHPRRAHPILDAHGHPTGKVSDAAGWPQFISTTWDSVRAENDFWYAGDAFSPANQDLGFLYLHRDTGAHAALMSGVKVDPYGHLTLSYSAFTAAISADSHQWASLPGENIGQSTGQHTRPLWWLWTQFQQALWTQMGYVRNIVHPIGAETVLTSDMGYQAWRGQTHWGQDFRCPVGTPIVAPEPGVVTLTGYEPKGGYYISFQPSTQPEVAVIFRHCQSESTVTTGQPLKAGKPFGHTGNSGQSTTAAHAHIEVTVDGHHIRPDVYLEMAA